jgi:hypothetical protein
MGKPWADHGQTQETGDPNRSLICAFSWTFLGADDGIRTRDPHLGKGDLQQLC